MALLVISNSVRTEAVAFPMLLVVTGCLGLGFGLTLGSISTYAGAFQPQRREVALTALNVLLGLGTALSPLLIALFLDIGEWWYLPLITAVGLAAVFVVALGLPLLAERLRRHRPRAAADSTSLLAVCRRPRRLRRSRDDVRELGHHLARRRGGRRHLGHLRPRRVLGGGHRRSPRHRPRRRPHRFDADLRRAALGDRRCLADRPYR